MVEDDEAELNLGKKANSELISPSKRLGQPKEKYSKGSKIGSNPEN